MRLVLCVLLLSGCAGITPPQCPPLPEIQPDQPIAEYTAIVIRMYRQCRAYNNE